MRHPFTISRIALVAAVIAGATVICLWFAKSRTSAAVPALPPAVVAATVDGQTISTAAAEHFFQKHFRSHDGKEDAGKWRAIALTQLVNQEVMLAELRERKCVVNEAELADLLIAKQADVLEAGQTWEEFLYAEKLSEDDLRRNLLFEETWKRYLKIRLTDEELQELYKSRRREFDGTELRIQHILLTGPRETWAERDELRNRLWSIRGDITFERLTFNEAVQKHSQAADASQQGDLGFIGRWGPMPEEFSNEAFLLPADIIGRPVESMHGMHLIKVVEERPGKLTWKDVKDRVRSFAEQELHTSILETSLDAVIEYTGAYPYFDRRDGKLVMPEQAEEVQAREGVLAQHGPFSIMMPEYCSPEASGLVLGKDRFSVTRFMCYEDDIHYEMEITTPESGKPFVPNANDYLLGLMQASVEDSGLVGERSGGKLVRSNRDDVQGFPAVTFEMKIVHHTPKGELPYVVHQRIVQMREHTVQLVVKGHPDKVLITHALNFWKTFKIAD